MQPRVGSAAGFFQTVLNNRRLQIRDDRDAKIRSLRQLLDRRCSSGESGTSGIPGGS